MQTVNGQARNVVAVDIRMLALRWDPTTKIVVPPGTEFCTRVRERLRGEKMQKITNLHETFASLDNLSKSGIMR